MDFDEARAKLVTQLSTEIKDKRVLAAMARVPRERFIPLGSRHLAYADGPLPIGNEQTISQPYIVACMTEALELKGDEKVLEIGTGSGYQTAILAGMVELVISTERIPAFADSAKKILDDLGYNNVQIHVTGEELGWKPDAPYAAIIVTAGAPKVPEDLLSQLAIGGRMVIPVGSRYVQELYRVTRHRDKNLIENLGGCRFVNLIGKGAWNYKS